MAEQTEMHSTIDDIDNFERRLQLKTFQEGLKHKAASVDITPAIVEEAVSGGLADYKAKFEVRKDDSAGSVPKPAPEPEMSVASEDSSSKKVSMNASSASTAPSAAVGEKRILVVEILHGSDLEGPALEWKTGAKAAACHPFCLVEYKAQLARGKTIRSSRNPVFRDALSLHAPHAGPVGSLTITVYCQEGVGEADTLVGRVEVDVDHVIREEPGDVTEGVHKWLNLSGGVSGSLHVTFKVRIQAK